MWTDELRQTSQQEMRETQVSPRLDRRSRLESTDGGDQDGREWEREN
jgi:hypothetical protein